MKDETKNDHRVPEEFLYLIELLRAVLLKQPGPRAPEGLDYAVLYRLAKRHFISATVFLVLPKEQMPAELYREWQNRRDALLRKAILFDAEREALLRSFEEDKVCYLPLKGILLKDFYRTGTREFSDNDILVFEKDAETVRKIMRTRGYEEKLSDVHDAYLKPPVYNFEIHKMLFEKNNPCYEAFRDIFSRAEKTEGSDFCYRMSDEDFFLYNTAHFYKHYDNAGAGLRNFADFWLMKEKFLSKPDFDSDYAEKLKERAGIKEFYRFLCEITDALFLNDGKALDEETLYYIYVSGVYGTFEHSIKNSIRKQGKAGFIGRRLFLPYHYMKQRFPVLRYLPVLLPLFWVIRFFIFFFDKKQRKDTITAIHEKK